MPEPRRRRPVRVACVGHASVDHWFEIDAFPGAPTKTPATSHRVQAGGMSFNAALAAARLGAAVRLLGRVGQDDAARLLRRRLAEEGIEARGLETVRGASTSVSVIVVDARGERQIFSHRGDAVTRAHALDTRQLEGADVVLVDPRWVVGAEAALRWARQRSVLSMLDADVAPLDDLRRLVPLARWTVFSEAGFDCWAQGATIKHGLLAARAMGCEAAMVTCGAQGSWRSDGRRLVHEGITPVIALDTTAAGDVFHAALAVALAEGRDAASAVRWASAAAAFKCERGMAAAGAPRRNELERWRRQR